MDKQMGESITIALNEHEKYIDHPISIWMRIIELSFYMEINMNNDDFQLNFNIFT